MTTIPELSHGFVTGRFLAGVADSADPGSEPDAMPMEGTVTFTASATTIRVLSETLGPVTVFPRDIQIWLDSEGYLSLNGSRQIALWATDDPDANPTAWQWTATAALKFQGTPVSDRIIFELPTGATVDLTTVAPIQTPSPGVVITRGPAGRRGSIWYVSSADTPDYFNVQGMLEGDLFLYPSSRDFFRYDGAEWTYAGLLGSV